MNPQILEDVSRLAELNKLNKESPLRGLLLEEHQNVIQNLIAHRVAAISPSGGFNFVGLNADECRRIYTAYMNDNGREYENKPVTISS